MLNKQFMSAMAYALNEANIARRILVVDLIHKDIFQED
jgi:hypothetical protein